MKEENKGASKNKWSSIFRKKWFFPAVYLTVAAILLAVVVWYNNLDNQVPDVTEGNEELTDNYSPNPHGDDAETVMDQQEVVKMPVNDHDQAEIVTKYYDFNAEEEDQANALILYNNRYYQSTGIDIKFADDQAFDVVASLSGTVTEVKEDPLLGNVVILSHDNDVTTYYASLGEVNVEPEDEVKQGDVIGTAGQNLFGKDNGTHVHFELRKDGKDVNPEEFFNQPLSKLDASEETTEQQDNENSGDQEEGMDEEEPSESSEDDAEDDDEQTSGISTDDEEADSTDSAE
ncbi:peptidoglycan DD-metalloendopeptidase family protein [Ornithinibacillus sp. L9]|uniref:Peptidoglycan DD-metalloendopeptidase family protein n=1 Tax=Ornithinibacillus caprae TaxID=2678566 RepID=A0A6N8FLS4_9BACI|nr:M23 family metallopeptidase [Ornithinibacillus caprae]MUK89676.1 peptidoglycan DD-metalloendopeptidase family protein [Ornithinibacillus caprae]